MHAARQSEVREGAGLIEAGVAAANDVAAVVECADAAGLIASVAIAVCAEAAPAVAAVVAPVTRRNATSRTMSEAAEDAWRHDEEIQAKAR